MLARSGALFGFVVLVSGCAPPRGQQLCDAIARRDVAAVQQLLAGPPINATRSHGTCVPANAVFAVAKPDDKVLTGIGIELLSAGLPADASWIAPGRAEPVWAIEAAAGNGNAELVRALIAVGLDVKSPEATRALVLAAGAGHLRVVQLLVQEGADLEATSGGETALDRARAKGQDDVVQFLEATAAKQAPAPAAKPG
ncbi:MAG: ankyrin repeat domain-containing protein [Vicinamibacteria bacterium]